MKKRNISNNRLFRKIRELEEKAIEAGIIEKSYVKTSKAMREELWEYYLVGRMKWLEGKISYHELKAGGEK